MKFNQKLMFLGVKEFSSKDGKLYKRVGLLDKDTQSTFVIFCNDSFCNKVKDYKLYNDYDFTLVLSVRPNGIINVGVE